VARLLVVFHHGSSGDFFGAFAIATRTLRGFLDVLVHPLFFITDTSWSFSDSRHDDLLLYATLNALVRKKLI
jgi:hypothetical protein